MIIDLERFAYAPHATLGRLILPGTVLYTIERPWLDNTPFKSCIPEGVYKVEKYSSQKYPDVWELQGVPERSKILIHAANKADDVMGCIGPGMGWDKTSWSVTHSRNAMTVLRSLLPEEFEINVTHYIPQYP